MRRWTRGLLIALCATAALVTWNAVFDASVTRGAREYVDRQQLFVEGRGPRVDMDAIMRGAVASGLRSATLWSLIPLAPLALLYSTRFKRHHP